MKTLGIVVEYNPFHNGHLYHMQKAIELTNPDCVICVMSGNFVQRGELALIDKHSRAQTAIIAGANLVVELPYVYAVQNANLFAFGAIDILNKLGVDTIVFGSENGNIKELSQIANILDTSEYNEQIKNYLQEGYSYPKASSLALSHYQNYNIDYSLPNNTLGIHYLMALKRSNSKILPFTVKRLKSSYHEIIPNDNNITSATSIRKMVKDNNNDYKNYVPTYVKKIIKNCHFTDQCFNYLKYQLLSSSSKELEKIHDVSEGIENLFIKTIKQVNNYENFIDSMTSKRYTRSKLQRLSIHFLNNITKKEIEQAKLDQGVQYIRFLKMDNIGKDFLKIIKGKTEVPIITGLQSTKSIHAKIELKTTNIYALIANNDTIIKNEFDSRNVLVST